MAKLSLFSFKAQPSLGQTSAEDIFKQRTSASQQTESLLYPRKSQSSSSVEPVTANFCTNRLSPFEKKWMQTNSINQISPKFPALHIQIPEEDSVDYSPLNLTNISLQRKSPIIKLSKREGKESDDGSNIGLKTSKYEQTKRKVLIMREKSRASNSRKNGLSPSSLTISVRLDSI